MHTYAQELVGLQPDVIFAPTSEAVAAIHAATRTIPIVFTGGTDPVAKGLVASMARPGGNVPGFANNGASIATKRLQLLKQIAPRIMQVALMYDPLLSSDALAFLAELHVAASSISVEVSGAAVHNPADIKNALVALAARPGSGFVVYSGGSTFTYLDAIITEAAKQGIPAIYRDRHYVAAGGLASYGSDGREGHRGAATYVDRILRGAKPSDLPVQQPTKFQFVINLKTAKALGLTIPETLLATADEVIQ